MARLTRLVVIILVSATTLPVTLVDREASAQCVPTWSAQPGPLPGLDGPVYAAAAWTPAGENVPRLAMVGNFFFAGDQAAWTIVEGWAMGAVVVWSPGGWLVLPNPGMPLGAVASIRGDLYVAGSRSTPGPAVFRWTGAGWEGLEDQPGQRGRVSHLIEWQGEPVAVFVNLLDRRVARWSGGRWVPLGPLAARGEVCSIAVHNGELVIGVQTPLQATVGPSPRSAILRWSGEAWVPYGPPIAGRPQALRSYGGRLYAAGGSGFSGQLQWSGTWATVASTDGRQWTGVDGGPSRPDSVALAEHAGELWMTTGFRSAALNSGGQVWKLVGNSWSAIASPPTEPLQGTMPDLRPLTTVTGATSLGDSLAVFGGFRSIGGAGALGAALRTADGSWRALGRGFDGPVWAMARHQGRLVVAGRFLSAGDGPASGIAAFDGDRWSPLGSGLRPLPNEVYPTVDGMTSLGEMLVVGGGFAAAGENAGPNIAAWNGASWAPLGNGLPHPVGAVAVYGKWIVAASVATIASGWSPVYRTVIWRYLGDRWEPMGEPQPGSIVALAVHHGVLYAGGRLNPDRAGDLGLLRWDGAAWRGVDGTEGWRVQSLLPTDDRLLVGGALVADDGWGMSAAWLEGEKWIKIATGWPVSTMTQFGGNLFFGYGQRRLVGVSGPHEPTVIDRYGRLRDMGRWRVSDASVLFTDADRLWAGGGFSYISEVFPPYSAILSPSLATFQGRWLPPVTVRGPAEPVACGGAITIQASTPVPVDSVEWTWFGGSPSGPLEDGVSRGLVVSGAKTPRLTVSGILPDRVAVGVRISDGCTPSEGATWLATVRRIPGDISGDYRVSALDLGWLLNAFGRGPGDLDYLPGCDIDGNGVVGANDLAILLSNFGVSCP
ncbi:MAG: hypothetical protein IBJ11_05750 [Phycisphaerales bacterium]|nr:hypothetical protein [Phycisphaerales bacterium]